MRQNEKQPNREVCTLESMHLGGREKNGERQRKRESVTGHRGADKGVRSMSIQILSHSRASIQVKSQAFVTALERKWSGGGRGKAYQISTFA